jgi:hypothetical protein
MKLRFLTTPLLATSLLLTTFGCAKKDDPAATPAVGTGSYKLDNTTITCQAKALTSSASSGGLAYDYLEVDLTTTPQPASGPETLKLYFFKPGGQPANAFTLREITLDTKGSSYPFSNDVTTLTSPSTSTFSGTFSATASGSVPYRTITAGVFTNARP